QDLQTRPQIAAPEGAVRIGFQGARRLADRPRLALDLHLELDRGVREIVALERLLRRMSRSKAKRQRGADGHGANQTDHGESPRGPQIDDGRHKNCEKVTGRWRESKRKNQSQSAWSSQKP